MYPTRSERLAELLKEFTRASDVDGAAVVSADGLPMASVLPQSMDEERLSAMTAAMLSLGERASETLGRGKLTQVFVEGSDGYVFLMAAGPAVLCAVTPHESKLGLVLFEMRRASHKIGQVLEGADRPARAPAPGATPAAAPAPAPLREQSAG